MKIGQTPKEGLECELNKEARDVCKEAGDDVSMGLFETVMKDEEGHIDFLEIHLELHDRIGAENFVQLNATKLEDAD